MIVLATTLTSCGKTEDNRELFDIKTRTQFCKIKIVDEEDNTLFETLQYNQNNDTWFIFKGYYNVSEKASILPRDKNVKILVEPTAGYHLNKLEVIMTGGNISGNITQKLISGDSIQVKGDFEIWAICEPVENFQVELKTLTKFMDVQIWKGDNLVGNYKYNAENDEGTGFLGLGGNYNVFKNNTFFKGDTVKVFATPHEGYNIKKLEIDGKSFQSGASLILKGNSQIVAEGEFAEKCYQVTYSENMPHSDISIYVVESDFLKVGEKVTFYSKKLSYGDKIKITVYRVEGLNYCKSITINGVQHDITYSDYQTFYHTVTGDVNIVADIALETFHFEPIYLENATISYELYPTGEKIEDFASYEFKNDDVLKTTIEASEGYRLLSYNITINNPFSVSFIDYVGSNLQNDLNNYVKYVSVVPTKTDITITASEDFPKGYFGEYLIENGVVTPPARSSHYVGQKIGFSEFVSFDNELYNYYAIVNGVQTQINASWEYTLPEGPVEISFFYEPIPVSWDKLLIQNDNTKATIKLSRNGELLNRYGSEIYYRDNITCEVVANEGYYIKSIQTAKHEVCLNSMFDLIESWENQLSPFEFSFDKQYCIYLKVEAEPKVYDLSLSAQNGYVELLDENHRGVSIFAENDEKTFEGQIKHFEKYYLQITPEEDYKIKSITINGEDFDINVTKIELNISGHLNIEVVCEYSPGMLTLTNVSEHDLNIYIYHDLAGTNVQKFDNELINGLGSVSPGETIEFAKTALGFKMGRVEIGDLKYYAKTITINGVEHVLTLESNELIPIGENIELDIIELHETADVYFFPREHSASGVNVLYTVNGSPFYTEINGSYIPTTYGRLGKVGDEITITALFAPDVTGYQIDNIVINGVDYGAGPATLTLTENITNVEFYWSPIDYSAEGLAFVGLDENGDVTNINYEITSYAVSSYTGNSVKVKIPAYYNGKPVSKICDNVFENSAITNIILQATLKEIGANAFKNSQLTGELYLESVEKIGESAFYFTKITKILSGYYVTTKIEIGANAFYGCNKLADVQFNTYTELIIGANAFYACNNLTSVNFNSRDDVSINNYAFAQCDNLEHFDLTNANFMPSIGENILTVNPVLKIYVNDKKELYLNNIAWSVYSNYIV